MLRRRPQRRPSEPAELAAAPEGPLGVFFAPRRVAVLGDWDDPACPAHRVLENLSRFKAEVHAVGRGAPALPGVGIVADIGEVAAPVDLAVVGGPAAEAPERIRCCVDAGVRAAVLCCEGFREAGTAGMKLEEALRLEAGRGKMRILGPNSIGLMSPHLGLNASPCGPLAHPGSVAFLSQSGALCASVLDWSLAENVGFSGIVSAGAMLDVGWGDLIHHFGDDPQTRSIVIFMETVGDVRSLLSAAREVSLAKPVIVLKVGRSAVAAQAAVSHTGTLTTSDAVLDAAFRRVGVLRVDTIAELFDMAEVLAKQPRPSGPALAIVTNAGGPGVLAADAVISGGGTVASLGPESFAALDRVLPGHWSRGDPVDILGDASPETYKRAVELAAADPGVDGVLVIFASHGAADPAGAAEAVCSAVRPPGKPVLTSWMGGEAMTRARELLNGAGFPTSDHPDAAARAFCNMWRHSYALRGIYETPAQVAEPPLGVDGRGRASDLVASARAAERSQLTEVESKELLASYGLPVSPTWVALSENEAVRLANKAGYPVVLKLHSETLTHKTEVGGVQLNLRNPIAVREAWRSIETHVAERAHRSDFLGVTVQPMIVHNGCEIFLGSTLDLDFGPVLVFGAGGQMAGVFRDRALALPPLNATLALRLMEQTRVFAALQGGRGRKAVDLAKLEALLIRFSYLVLEHPEIAEIDVNPLIVAPETIVAVDARVVLHPPTVDLATLPRPAIRPYPNQYVSRRKLGDGTPVTVRPILPEDEPRLVEFHRTLSDRSVYHRYFCPLKLSERIAHERLARVCFSDYDREIPLVAEHRPEAKSPPAILGIGRLSRAPSSATGEFAVIVTDGWQGRGLGQELLERVIGVAREEGLARLVGHVLSDNREMLALCRKLGFSLHHATGDAECIAELFFNPANPIPPIPSISS